MLSVKLNEEEVLAILYPEGALSKEDFVAAKLWIAQEAKNK